MTGSRVFWSCLSALVLTASPGLGAETAIRLQKSKDGHTVEVTGLGDKVLAELARLLPDAEQWGRIFTLRVDRGKAEGELPAMLGTCQIEKGVLRFTPRFPLARGVSYRAVFNPAALPGGAGKPVETVLSLPKPVRAPTAVVAQVYPTTDRLPENHLRFYLHFSAPMSQGDSFRHLKLLDAGGKVVAWPFLEMDFEMWDEAGKRFTLFFDPGRIKRGLKPREDLGPILEEGKRYTLVIDRAWEDAEGTPMKETFRKSFTVGPPDDTIPDAKKWKLTTPTPGTQQPIRITFPESLDHALLHRLVWVSDAEGKTVTGKVEVKERETVWLFTPDRPWREGAYALVADTRLEDLAGNNLRRLFEVDVFRPVQRTIKTDTVQVPFQVKK